MTAGTAAGRGGRPTAAAAARLADGIVEVATAAFLREGYAATSIESVAKQARVGKRTIYARFADKEALFAAVLGRLMTNWLADPLPEPIPGRIEATLAKFADRMLAVALQPEALALHRLLLAESGRFRQIPAIARAAGTSAGATRIAAVLQAAIAAGDLPNMDVTFAAEQFMHLVLTGPQRRALGVGAPLDRAELAEWSRRSVALFLHGCRESPAGTPP